MTAARWPELMRGYIAAQQKFAPLRECPPEPPAITTEKEIQNDYGNDKEHAKRGCPPC
jgi:hypothetical protein